MNMGSHHPSAFRNIDNRRVLDDDGRQGIDGVTGLGSDTEIVCGQLLEQLLWNAIPLPPASLNNYLAVAYYVRDERMRGVLDFTAQQGPEDRDWPALAESVSALYQWAPRLAPFQLDDLIAWAFILRDGAPHPTTRDIFDDRW
jgi:hypothetical protein